MQVWKVGVHVGTSGNLQCLKTKFIHTGRSHSMRSACIQVEVTLWRLSMSSWEICVSVSERVWITDQKATIAAEKNPRKISRHFPWSVVLLWCGANKLQVAWDWFPSVPRVEKRLGWLEIRLRSFCHETALSVYLQLVTYIFRFIFTLWHKKWLNIIVCTKLERNNDPGWSKLMSNLSVKWWGSSDR